ncbi:hypothetical protein RvY_15256-2 [Ramazzottius varieornatus]|uniref:Uncharacterized protein n=1 Tax=Ramazzottius varieornatus TaxID=947166 RepID=A0A1D1VVK6_RAMVA|nr:hypothetical protein RvY_15256-2 [Ramazzottius varieornatus]
MSLFCRSLGPEAVRKSLKSHSIVEPDDGERARIDVVKLRNTELIVVDFEDDDEHALAMADAQRRFLYPGPPGSGLSVIKEASSIGLQSSRNKSESTQLQDSESIQQSLTATDQPSYQSSSVSDAEALLHSHSKDHSASVIVQISKDLSDVQSFVTQSSMPVQPAPTVPSVRSVQKLNAPMRMTVSETIRAQPTIVAHPNPFTLAVQRVKSDTTSLPFQMTVSETVTTQPTVVSHPNPFILAGLISGKRSAKVAPAPQEVTLEMQERLPSIKSVPSVQVKNTPVSQTEMADNQPTQPASFPARQITVQVEPTNWLQPTGSVATNEKRPTVKDRLSVLEKHSAQSQQSDGSAGASVVASWSIRSQAGSTRALGGAISGVSSIKSWSTMPRDVQSQYSNDLEAPSTTTLTHPTKHSPSFDASSLTMAGNQPRLPQVHSPGPFPDEAVIGVNSLNTYSTLPQMPSSNAATVGTYTGRNNIDALMNASPPSGPQLYPSVATVDSSDGSIKGVTSVKTWATLPAAPSTNPGTVGSLSNQTVLSTIPTANQQASSDVVSNFFENSRTFSQLHMPAVTSASLPQIPPANFEAMSDLRSLQPISRVSATQLTENNRTLSEMGISAASLPGLPSVKTEMAEWPASYMTSSTTSSNALPAVASVKTWSTLPSASSANKQPLGDMALSNAMMRSNVGMLGPLTDSKTDSQSMSLQKQPTIFDVSKPMQTLGAPMTVADMVPSQATLEHIVRVLSTNVPSVTGTSADSREDTKANPAPSGETEGPEEDSPAINLQVINRPEETAEPVDDSKERVKSQWRSLLDKQVTRRRSSLPAAIPLILQPTQDNKVGFLLSDRL